MAFNIKEIAKDLIGTSVSKPKVGTLSGHAAGEPFDKHAYECLKRRYPGKTYRQFEYLNELYSKNRDAVSHRERHSLISPPFLAEMINRGVKATNEWTIAAQFDEKQNDTADIILTEGARFRIIDVKTKNMSKNAQPPNIISALKVAKMCASILDDGELDGFEIIYLGITWKENGSRLECTDCVARHLFKSNPAALYINWAAAMQIQFNVETLDQGFSGSLKEWARGYLGVFTKGARERSDKMLKDYVCPYLRHIQ